MKRITKYQMVAVFFALCLTATIYLLPKSPLANSNNLESNSPAVGATKTNEAIELVLSGDQPMSGIMMLRDVLEEDKGNKSALLALGLFSIQSGQFEKALERFTQVSYKEKENTLSEDIGFIGKSYYERGIMMEVIHSIEKFKAMQEGNQELAELLNNIIKEFKTYK